MADKKAPNLEHLSDTDLQIAYEKARAAMQHKNQEALDSTEETKVFETYEAERERRHSKSDLEKAAEKES